MQSKKILKNTKEFVYKTNITYSLISIYKNKAIKLTSCSKSHIYNTYFYDTENTSYEHYAYLELEDLQLYKKELNVLAPVNSNIRVNDVVIEDLQEKSEILSNIQIASFKMTRSCKTLSESETVSSIKNINLFKQLNNNLYKLSNKDIAIIQKTHPHLFI